MDPFLRSEKWSPLSVSYIDLNRTPRMERPIGDTFRNAHGNPQRSQEVGAEWADRRSVEDPVDRCLRMFQTDIVQPQEANIELWHMVVP